MSGPRPFPVRVATTVFDLFARILPADVRGGFDREIRESFLDEATDAYKRGGTLPLVRATFGALADVAVTSRAHPSARKGQPMQAFAHDLRYALRAFRRQPGFTLSAVLMLTVGIGANTAIFTLVNASLLRALPYPDADRLVRVWGAPPDLSEADRPINPNDANDWRRGSPGLEALGVSAATSQPLSGAGDPVAIPVALVSSGFLETLQVQPAMGRLFGPEHDLPGHDNDIVITDGFWRRVLGADPGAVGRTVRLADVTCTIIGVLPPEFVSPGMRAGAEPHVLRPLVVPPDNRGGHFAAGIARLKPGASLAEVQSQINRVAERLAREFPSTNREQRARLEPLHEAIAGDTRPAVLLLMAAVGVVLLIACANVANLLLARAALRRREFAIRGALGATRGRLVRQMLTESTLLAAGAATAGVTAGALALSALPGWLTEQLPTVLVARLDARVLAFSLLLSVGTVILFGLAPALIASRHDLRGTLAATSPGGGGGLRAFQSGLVVLEAALALILLVSATFLVQSLVRLQRVDPGFTADATLTFRITLPRTRYQDPSRRNLFFSTVVGRLSAQPGVVAVGGVNTSPLSGRFSCDSFGLGDRPAPQEGTEPCAEVRAATPGYFRAMGMALLAGREIEASDRADSPFVAIISQSMARRYWPDGNPLGKRFKWGSLRAETPWRTIVGVIGDVKHYALDEEAPDEVYMPLEQVGATAMTFAVRVREGGAWDVRDQVRGIVSEMDPSLPVAEVFTTSELVSRSTALPAFRTQLLTVFAAVALLLALAGVYAVMTFHVTQRRREIGVRLALGATSGEVRHLVVVRGAKLVAVGCVIGMAVAFPLMGLLREVLFGVTPREPLPYAVAPVILLATAVLASYLPAHRATTVDPVETMRTE